MATRKSTVENPVQVMRDLFYQQYRKTGLVPEKKWLIDEGAKLGVWAGKDGKSGTAATQAGYLRKELLAKCSGQASLDTHKGAFQ